MAKGYSQYANIILSYLFDGTGTMAQYRFVKLASDTQITPVTATSDLVVGVALETTAKTDLPVQIGVDGIFPVECGGTVTRGKMVEITANGRVKDYSSGKIVGMALKSGTSGDIVPVLVRRVGN